MINIRYIIFFLILYFIIYIPIFGDSGRYALVIGNSSYTSHPLKNPVNDAEDMTHALKEIGFEVTTLKNARFQQMEDSIKAFGRKLINRARNKTGLFYYSGHGIQVKGQNYLLPVDKNIEEMERGDGE
jgi:uncharacterized caspase-like protein